jgi:ferredoxin-thioredoxin reductase catalytic subunit
LAFATVVFIRLCKIREEAMLDNKACLCALFLPK